MNLGNEWRIHGGGHVESHVFVEQCFQSVGMQLLLQFIATTTPACKMVDERGDFLGMGWSYPRHFDLERELSTIDFSLNHVDLINNFSRCLVKESEAMEAG